MRNWLNEDRQQRKLPKQMEIYRKIMDDMNDTQNEANRRYLLEETKAKMRNKKDGGA